MSETAYKGRSPLQELGALVDHLNSISVLSGNDVLRMWVERMKENHKHLAAIVDRNAQLETKNQRVILELDGWNSGVPADLALQRIASAVGYTGADNA